MQNKIIKWMENKVSTLTLNNPASFEFDQFFDNYHSMTGEEKLDLFFNVFNIAKDYLVSTSKNNIQLDLQLELEPSFEFILILEKKNELLELMTGLYVPELILFIPKKNYWLPKMEYHVYPINFCRSENSNMIFSQYKAPDDKEYNRWITLTFETLIDK